MFSSVPYKLNSINKNQSDFYILPVNNWKQTKIYNSSPQNEALRYKLTNHIQQKPENLMERAR